MLYPSSVGGVHPGKVHAAYSSDVVLLDAGNLRAIKRPSAETGDYKFSRIVRHSHCGFTSAIWQAITAWGCCSRFELIVNK